MAKFLIGTIPVIGHITPILPIARKLCERGHEVRWYTGTRFRAKVEATGARFVPVKAAPDVDGANLNAFYPERGRLRGLAQLKYDMKHIFMDAAVGQVKDCEEILQEFPADVLLADSAFAAADILHERGGPPWAIFNSMPVTLSSRDTAPFGLGLSPSSSLPGRLRNALLQKLMVNVLLRDTTEHRDAIRQRLGVPAQGRFVMDASLSPYLYLQGTIPSFEYPRSDLAPQVHFIGPMRPEPPADFTPPAWWEDLKSGRPVVHVTQGTVATEPDQLLLPTLQALAGQDVLVVATTGGRPVQELGLSALPDNVRLEAFIPHAHLLPRVDVMVTNGGYNGVQVALAHGVPLVAAGASEDKPEVCARVAWAGVGVNLKSAKPGKALIRKAVWQVLREPRYRKTAQRFAEEFARHDAPLEAARLLEQLASTRKPVLAQRG
jgi:MGT family glycosyltransferase